MIENAIVGALMVFCAYVWIWYFVGHGESKLSIFMLGTIFTVLLGDMVLNPTQGIPRMFAATSAGLVMWVARIHDKKVPSAKTTINSLRRYFSENMEE